MAKGAHVNPSVGEPPLLVALETDPLNTDAPDLTMLRLLLARGANANVRDAQGRTPLALARATRNRAVIHLLEQHGARR